MSPRTLVVMGMAKNTGKTVCLNHLLRQAHAAHVPLGLTSIGRDGEARDEVFSIPKPPVVVPRGCRVATARGTLARARLRTRVPAPPASRARWARSRWSRCSRPARWKWPARRAATSSAGRSRCCGSAAPNWCCWTARSGRSQHASPAIADAVVLATGAAVGGGVQDVLRKTRERLAVLGVAPADDGLACRVAPAFDCGGVGAWRRDGGTPLRRADRHAQRRRRAARAARRRRRTIAVSGAVGARLWSAVQALARPRPGLALVVSAMTRAVRRRARPRRLRARATAASCARCARSASRASRSIPSPPSAAVFDAHDFLAQARAALPGHGVCDVMLPHA